MMDDLKELKKIELEEDTLKDLDMTRKWAMFLAILGFIAIGLMVIIGLVAGVFLFVFKTQNSGSGIPVSLAFLILLVVAVIYFFPVLYLYNFSKHLGLAVRTLDKGEMKKGFQNLKRYYVYMGIMVILILVLYFVALIASGGSLALIKGLGNGM